ncbi:MAG: BamA/TamA family outer membrane protein [candidate division WOR-3 bacterium]
MRNFIILFLQIWLVTPLFAYTFGKNKLQTRDYPFKVYETNNFRIFSYSESDFLVKFAEYSLEKAYEEYVETFGFRPQIKIPVIIYNSPKHFSETNVIIDVIEEGVGGFTEIFKNRIVVPFTGSYKDFNHVLRHELVHAFQYELMKRSKRSTLQIVLSTQIPLWCIEGLAEYLSIGWSPDAERYIRNLIISDNLPSIEELNYYGGYIVYKVGQLIYKFIDDTYGRQKISEFYSLLIYTNSIEKAVKRSFGLDLKGFNARFREYVRQNFYVALGYLTTPVNLKRFSDHEKMRNFYNVAPVVSYDGSTLYYIQEKRGNFHIVKYSTASGEKLATVFKSSKTPNFENIHILRPSLSLTKDGRKLVFSAQTGEGDVIYIFDTMRRKILKTIKFDLDAIYTPSISPDGKALTFCGLKDGKSDIYLYFINEERLIRITDDPFDDRDPSFGENGNIIFSSDRNEQYGQTFRYGCYAIFSYNILTGEISKLSDYYRELANPVVIDDSILLFTAQDSFNSINIFKINLKTSEISRITDFTTEVKWFSFSKTGRIYASILYANGYDVFEIKEFKETNNMPTNCNFSEYQHQETTTGPGIKYTPRFTLDWIYGSASLSSIYGFQGNVTFGISDELGDHQIMFTTDLNSNILYSNFNFEYWYLKKRSDYGLSFYQYWDAGYLTTDTISINRTAGIFLMQSIPYSKTRRTELGFDIELQEFNYFWITPFNNIIEIPEIFQRRFLTGLYIAHVFDNVYYSYIQDPTSGTRYYLGLLKSFPIDMDLNIAVIDLRHYFTFDENYILATRLNSIYSFGRDRYYTTFNGFDDHRGSYFGEQIGDKYFLLNTEFRFPFIKKLNIGFPLPLEISNIGGVMFFDAGICTANRLKDIRLFYEFPKLQDPTAAVGYGIRLWLGFAKLKLDFAHPTNLKSVNKKPLIKISLGFDY